MCHIGRSVRYVLSQTYSLYVLCAIVIVWPPQAYSLYILCVIVIVLITFHTIALGGVFNVDFSLASLWNISST